MTRPDTSGEYTFEVFRGLVTLPRFKEHCQSVDWARDRARLLANRLLSPGASIRIYSPDGRALDCVTLKAVVEMVP